MERSYVPDSGRASYKRSLFQIDWGEKERVLDSQFDHKNRNRRELQTISTDICDRCSFQESVPKLPDGRKGCVESLDGGGIGR